jgi:hypothetical protein
MRNKILVFIFTFLYAGMLMAGGTSPEPNQAAFRSTTCRTDFGSYPVSDGSSAEVVSAFVRSQIPNLQNKQAPLQLTFSNTSPGGYHYTFCQTYSGIPVFTAEVTVSVSRKNRIYSIFDDSYDISKWKVDLADFNYQDVAAYQAFVKQYFPYPVTQTASQVIVYEESTATPLLAYLVTVNDHKGNMRYAVVARDHIVYQRDGLMYYHGAAMPSDSVVPVRVNNPDPLTTAHVVYYGPYMGHDSAFQNFELPGGILDSCVVQLDTERWNKTITADFVNDTFYLNSHYIKLANPEGLGFTPAISTTPSFDFYRCEEGFGDVMVFYHLNTIRSYVNSLGFNSTDTPITADPHFYTQDESFFDEQSNGVYYGTGGVPDAEDADVIVHEYTHFISWNSNHSNGVGSSAERNSIDEASGDYDIASYSASIDTFKWNYVFTWDGHNPYWPGRVVDDRTVYPARPTECGCVGIYCYAMTWSSSLMQIWWAIGRGPADSLFFQCLYGLGGNIHLTDAARHYIAGDSLLFNGKYHCIITDIFNQHGLAYDSACSGEWPLGVADVTDRPGLFRFTAYPDGFMAAAQSSMPVDIDLYDMSGRKLVSYQNVSTEIKPGLPDGIYIVDVSTAGAHQGFKWALVR